MLRAGGKGASPLRMKQAIIVPQLHCALPCLALSSDGLGLNGSLSRPPHTATRTLQPAHVNCRHAGKKSRPIPLNLGSHLGQIMATVGLSSSNSHPVQNKVNQSRAVILLFALFPPLRILNSTIPWSQTQLPPAFTSQPILCFQSVKSSKTPSLINSSVLDAFQKPLGLPVPCCIASSTTY